MKKTPIIILMVLIVVTALVSLIVPWLLYIYKLTDVSLILKDFAVLNVTIAIGLIAATLGIDESPQKDMMMYLALGQIAVGVISYFLGLVELEIMSTVYLMLNGVFISASLATFVRHYQKF